MTATQIIETAAARGVRLSREGDALIVRAKKGVLTQSAAAKLAAQKAALLPLLPAPAWVEYRRQIRALYRAAALGEIPIPAAPLTVADVEITEPNQWVIAAEQRLRAAKNQYLEEVYLTICADDIAAFNELAEWWHDRNPKEPR